VGIVLVQSIGVGEVGVIQLRKKLPPRRLAKNLKARGIIGGLHLSGGRDERLRRTVEYLRRLAPDLAIPLHCSGPHESCALRQALREKEKFVGVGRTIVLP
jgi:metal-dependent hydrolase (beta-lactamase superfamily II)